MHKTLFTCDSGIWTWSTEYSYFWTGFFAKDLRNDLPICDVTAERRLFVWNDFRSSFFIKTRTYFFSASVLLFVRRICNGLFEIVVYSSRRRGRHWAGREDRRWGAHCSWIEVFSRRQIHLHWIGWLQVGLCVLITLSQFIFATLIAPSEWHFDGLWNCGSLDWDRKCTNLSL